MGSSIDLLIVARAEAIFSSDLPTGVQLNRAEIATAIEQAVRAHGGSRGCALILAGSYGDQPEIAVPRMRWALQQVRSCHRLSHPV